MSNLYIWLFCTFVLIITIFTPYIFKQFLNTAIFEINLKTESLLASLHTLVLTKQAKLYKRNLFHGKQYIIKIYTTQYHEHYFVLSIYENCTNLEIPNSNLNKKISINSKNYHVRKLIDAMESEYKQQQIQETYGVGNQTTIDVA